MGESYAGCVILEPMGEQQGLRLRKRALLDLPRYRVWTGEEVRKELCFVPQRILCQGRRECLERSLFGDRGASVEMLAVVDCMLVYYMTVERSVVGAAGMTDRVKDIDHK